MCDITEVEGWKGFNYGGNNRSGGFEGLSLWGT